jgi:hypothetical protein
MKYLFSALLLSTLTLPLYATTYYVSNSGNDSNTGTSASQAWATVTRVNQFLAAAGSAGPRPGDSVLFARGGVWRDDFITCQNPVNAAPGWTVTSHPPACSGSQSAPLTIGAYGTGSNPIIDAADPLQLSWTPVSGAMWKATLTSGTMPAKLYIDGATSETTQLIPVPNYAGAYNSGRTYNPYDGVTYAGSYARQHFADLPDDEQRP